jgi:hypothetical protein
MCIGSATRGSASLDGRQGPGFEPGSSRTIGTDGLLAPESTARKQMRRTALLLACGMNLLQMLAESSMARRDRLGGAPAGRNPTTMGRSALLERYCPAHELHAPAALDADRLASARRGPAQRWCASTKARRSEWTPAITCLLSACPSGPARFGSTSRERAMIRAAPPRHTGSRYCEFSPRRPHRV